MASHWLCDEIQIPHQKTTKFYGICSPADRTHVPCIGGWNPSTVPPGHPPFLFHMACYKYLGLWHLSCWHLFPALESVHWGHKDFVFISPNPNPYLTQLNNEMKTFWSVYCGTGTLRHCWWTFSCCHHFVVVQSLSCVQLFVTPWTAAHQASLSLTISRSLPKFMSIASVMPS